MEQSENAALDQWENELDDADFVSDDTTDTSALEPESTDATPASSDAPADASLDSPAPQTDDGEQQDDDAEKPAIDPAQPAPQTPIELKDFHVRVDGTSIELKGAKETPTHKIIPTDTWNRQIQPMLANRRALTEAHKAELQRVSDTKSTESLRASILLKKVDEQLLSSPEQAQEFLADFDKNLRLLQLEVQTELDATDRTHRQNEQKQKSESSERESLTTSVQSGLEQGVDFVLNEPAFASLGLDRRQMLATVWQFRASLVREATADDQDREPGELVVDLNALRRLLEPAASVATRERANNQQVSAAEKQNQAALRKATAPPAVASRGAPVMAGKATAAPQTRQEWEDSLA